MMTPTERILSALATRNCDPKRNGRGWSARCPAHEDRTPSLSIAEGDDGRALVRCHAGCSTEAVCGTLGLTLADLMPSDNGRPAGRPERLPARLFKTVAEAAQDLERRYGTRTGLWTYHNDQSEPVGLIVRWDGPQGKIIRPVSRGADGRWYVGAMPEPRPLYGLTALGTAKWVFVVEGEKAADAARSIGLLAVTSAGGSKAAGKTDWAPLVGRECVILPDNDEAGRGYAGDVAAILATLTPVPVVKVVELSGLPPGGDLVDWLDQRDAHDPDELRATIEAMADKTPQWAPTKNRGPVVRNMADVTPENIRWLWPGRFAMGKLALLAGDPGLGKSVVALDVAARVSRGAPWPDDATSAPPRGGVVLLTAEDDLADTVRPRLDAAWADVRLVNVLEAIRGKDDRGDYRRAVDLSRDLCHVEEAIGITPDCRLVIVDPISAYLGSTDSHKNAEVRATLAPLADLASRHRLVVLGITHLRKSAGPAVYRSIGSLAFVAAARATWAVTKDKDDESRRLFLPVKNNLAADIGGLAFRVVDNGGGVPTVEWGDPVTVNVDDALAHQQQDDGPTGTDEAVDWLRMVLEDGPVAVKDISGNAKADGIVWRTVERAKKKLGIRAAREGYGGAGRWMWELPT